MRPVARTVDVLADLCRKSDGVLACASTGAGWGGCVVALVQDGCEAGVLEQVTRRQYVEATGTAGRGLRMRISAGRVRIAECRMRKAEWQTVIHLTSIGAFSASRAV